VNGPTLAAKLNSVLCINGHPMR